MNNMSFSYYMPTNLLVGENCVLDNYEIFKAYGKKALIVTDKISYKKNGSLHDCIKALEKNNIDYILFDDIEENPSVETIDKAAAIGIENNVDFCIGIGGGSPMDATKTIALLINNPDKKGNDLFTPSPLSPIPSIAIATTAGTGSETTSYSILTIHEKKTKQSIPHKVYFNVAFIDPKYTMHLPKQTTLNTGIDALTHLIESYLCSKANYLLDKLCESGFKMFAECKDSLFNFRLDMIDREKLLLMSSLAGICITQVGTSLPHGMGYALTYNHGLAHGAANGVLTAEYLKICNIDKVEKMLDILGFDNIEDFGRYLKTCLNIDLSLSPSQIDLYTKEFLQNKAKIQAHPYPVDYDMVYQIYKNSL